jgi:Baseplate J-like protein
MTDPLTESIGIYVPVLDPRNETDLVTQAQAVVFNRSAGTLNDFSQHSPLTVLLEGQAFAGSEFLYYINQLPTALVVKFLEATGTVRSLGQKATVTLTFTLSALRPIPFTVPVGFEVTTQSGSFAFFTESTLIIPAGSISGTVTAVAENIGTDYNVGSYTLNNFVQPLSFLAGVTNTEPAQGGALEESLASAVARGLTALRMRNLVSASDYEFAAEEVLGSGSKAKAIGLLNGNKVSESKGSVHVFALGPDGAPANASQILDIQTALSPRIQLGTKLWVSPMDTLPIRGVLNAKLLPEANPETVADGLWAAFQSYLSPDRINAGDTVIFNEVEYELRLAGGIEYIEQLLLNDDSLNIPALNAYTIAQPYSLFVQLVDDQDNVFGVLRGEGEPPDFDPQISNPATVYGGSLNLDLSGTLPLQLWVYFTTASSVPANLAGLDRTVYTAAPGYVNLTDILREYGPGKYVIAGYSYPGVSFTPGSELALISESIGSSASTTIANSRDLTLLPSSTAVQVSVLVVSDADSDMVYSLVFS